VSPPESEIDAVLSAYRDAAAELVNSAARWFSEALGAWTAEDHQKVAALAPLAVEHLGKAVLWASNPVLLVPLAPDAEGSLFELSTKPDLSSPKLRTIGLKIVLSRVEKLLGGLPIDQKRRARIVETRNGAVHIGSAPQSRHILVDCIQLGEVLLAHLGRQSSQFYGEYAPSVAYLLDEQRSEVQLRVAAKRARARQGLRKLEHDLGKDIFHKTTDSLESAATAMVDPTDFGPEYWDVAATCPECGYKGRILGSLDIDADVDFDVEPMGGGSYSSHPILGRLNATLLPHAFTCNVCKLILNGADELGEAGLPSALYEISINDLGDDFDLDLFLESQRYR
jgi:hypothetical protein